MDKVWYDSEMGTGAGEEAVHVKLMPHVRTLESDQRDVSVLNVLNAKLYSNRESMTFERDSVMGQGLRPISTNLENVIQSVVSTLVSKIGSNRPKASIISRGADFSVFLKSRQLERFMWGEFTHHGIHKLLERCFKDSCIYGTGFLKIDIDAGEVYCERVHPSEIVVDQRECISNQMPMQLHQRKLVSKLWLKKTYAKGKDTNKILEMIDHLPTEGFGHSNYTDSLHEQVLVLESWKLPTRKGAGDGRHTICVDNYTLMDEKYTRERFPFVIQKWDEPEAGFYGRSLVGDLLGYQIRLNELNEVIKYGQDTTCVPRMLVEQGSGVRVQTLDNNIAKVLRYRGVKPEIVTWNAFNAEIYNERDRIKSSAYEFAGLGEMGATGKLPSQMRMDSAEAVREVNATEDGRFNDKTQNYETSAKLAASHLIELNALIYKNKKISSRRTFRLGNLAEQIDWEEVDMETDKYVLEIGASSVVNMTPAARKDQLNSWLAGGIITPDQYKGWSGHEDLERLADTMSASKDYIEYHIDQMLKGRPTTPDRNMNIAEGFNTVLNTYQHIRTLECPDSIVALFLNWLMAAKEILQPTMTEPPMAAPMAPQGAMMPPDPMAGGMPPDPGMGDPMAQAPQGMI